MSPCERPILMALVALVALLPYLIAVCVALFNGP